MRVNTSVVVQADALTKIEAFIATLPVEPDVRTLLVQGDTSATARRASFFTTHGALERHLLASLDRAAIGLRLYVCGDEAFIWRIHRQSLARLSACCRKKSPPSSMPAPRAVCWGGTGSASQCGTTPSARSRMCRLWHQPGVVVRQHFSQRVGAYHGRLRRSGSSLPGAPRMNTIEVRVEATRLLTPVVREFTLVAAHGRLPKFSSGSHIQVQIAAG